MKILTVGTSTITSKFCNGVLKSKHSAINAVYSRDIERAKDFAKPFSAKSYSDYAKALRDEDVDTVYIASVNSLHFIHAKQALEAKKNVILEKPTTYNAYEFSHLLEVAKNNNVFIIEAITTMFLPTYIWLKENIHHIGPIKSVYAVYHQHSSSYKAYMNHEDPNIFSLTYGGGCLVDLNVYNLHFILSLFETPKSAKYYPILGHNGIDISGVAILDYGSFIAIASASKSHEGTQAVVVEGELGTLKVNSAANVMRQVSIQTRDVELYSDSIDTSNVLEFEVLVMEELIKNANRDEIDMLNKSSLLVSDVMSKIRKAANIHFKGEGNETLF